ncbi:MAG: NAD(P)/FAD-dependent oxidoreductase [Oscillospiraceae bacterium]|nr:NAD(P)/FAD-dependent oxidoreductase [Oscillospiraceae bacterium]
MPLIINNIRGELSENSDSVIKKGLKKAGISGKEVIRSGIYKTSLDARKRNDIHFIHSVFAELSDKDMECSFKSANVKCIEKETFSPEISGEKADGRIVIAGFGPAGMFCGLVLAEHGYRPLILERGEDAESRVESVKRYWSGGELNTESNVQFGEGGAGTFSDGKLTTRINDPLCRYVLERFVQFGAPEEILIKAKPHIGTDNLRKIVKNIRNRIIESGGEVKFSSRLDDIVTENGEVKKAVWNGNETETAALVAAVGHSARDTFEMLAQKQIFMEPKPFSVGVRIEHKQKDVNESLYGKYADNPFLPVGEYQLSHRRRDGRCVYTFCMCPGGHVVPAASEEKTVVTNGMSEFARDGENANAAVAVSVSPEDFGNGVLDGVDFARKIEQNAYRLTDGKAAPATTVRGFLNGKPDIDTDIKPTYERGVMPCEFKKIFPSAVTDMLEEGLGIFSRKMNCFGDQSALMTAPETRTSSPVRISRTENRNSISLKNFYPCGEGAGYAGGIMSAAVDGIKTAMEIMKRIAPEN